MFQKQFVAWNCNGYSAVPISNYINNPIFKELHLEKHYVRDNLDQRVYIDLDYTSEIEKLSRNDAKADANN